MNWHVGAGIYIVQGNEFFQHLQMLGVSQLNNCGLRDV